MKVLVEDINRMKSIMGLIVEQNSSVIVSGTYTATNCDELHAFQSSGGKVIGNMNVIVGNKLDELYKKGINPMVSKVDISVNGMTVNWSCTIVPSLDGKAWMGFTSRGAGCNNDVINRAESVSKGNDMESAKQRIISTFNEPNIDIEKINDFINTDGGTILKNKIVNGGGKAFRQVFYRYTKPNEFPPVGNNISKLISKKTTTPIISIPQKLTQDYSNEPPVSLRADDKNINGLNKKLNKYFEDKPNGDTLYSLKEMELIDDNNKLNLLLKLIPNKNGFLRFSILFNPKGSTDKSIDRELSKNPGSKVLKTGNITYGEDNDEYEYHLMGIK